MRIVVTGRGLYFNGRVFELLAYLRGLSADITISALIRSRLQ